MLSTKVVVVVLVAVVVVVPVAGNYSIATGGGMAAVDEMMGRTDKAGDLAVQAAKETKEVLGNWGGYWAKDKVQHGLTSNHSAGPSGVGKQIADKAGKAKEKLYSVGSEALHKTTDKAQHATEAISETTKDVANKAPLWKGKAVQQEDSGETSYKRSEGQNSCEEKEAAETDGKADGEAGSTKTDSNEEEAEEAKGQEAVKWAKQGYSATKRKASDALHNAKRKITITEACHAGEL